MGAIRGLDCKVYVNTGTYAAPTWAEWECVRDTTLDITFDEVDASCRGSGTFRQSTLTLGTLEVTGDAVKDKDDPSYIAMELAARNKTIMDVVVLDGPIDDDDSDGWRLDAQIMSWSESQPYEDVLTVDFTLKPAVSENAPTPFTGTSPP